MYTCVHKKTCFFCGRTFEYERFANLEFVGTHIHKYGSWESRYCTCKTIIAWEHNPTPSQITFNKFLGREREKEFVG